MAATLRYFTKDEEDPKTWHAYREDGQASLCGEAQLSYNVDPIADTVPDNGVFHLACREALDAETDPDAVAATIPAEAAPAEDGDGDSPAEGEAVDDRSKVELQDDLREQGLPTSGTKDELHDRLDEAAAANE